MVILRRTPPRSVGKQLEATNYTSEVLVGKAVAITGNQPYLNADQKLASARRTQCLRWMLIAEFDEGGNQVL